MGDHLQLLQERKKLQEDEGSQVGQACKGSPSTMLVIPLLTLLSQLSGYAVQAEKDEKKNCSELGFNTPNLMCSDCETLGRFQVPRSHHQVRSRCRPHH